MKDYLLSIRHASGAVLRIVANTDSGRPIQLLYCGQDSGLRYKTFWGAARYLGIMAANWGAACVEKTYGPASSVPVYGSDEWNIEQFKADYFGGGRFDF